MALCLLAACKPAPTPVPSATFDAVSPSYVDVKRGGSLSLTISHFVPQVIVDFDEPERSQVVSRDVGAYLRSGDMRVDLTGVFAFSDTEVRGVVPADLALGVYDVHVLSPRGEDLSLAQQLEVLDCTAVDCSSACSEVRYRDLDGDGYGTGFGQKFCSAGWAVQSGDCNDADALSSPANAEICNGLDDDCDGVVDDGVCTDSNWVSAVSLGSGNFQKLAKGSGFTATALEGVAQSDGFTSSRVTGCPTPAGPVATNADGVTELSADQTLVTVTAGACTAARTLPQSLIAMTAIGSDFFGVASNGQLYRWTAGADVQFVGVSNLIAAEEVFAIGGLGIDQLYVAGARMSGNYRASAIWKWNGSGWSPQTIADIAGRLRALHVLSATSIFAAGDNGVAFRLGTRAGWEVVPNDEATPIFGVRGFGFGRLYVAQSNGVVRQFSGGQWRVVYSGSADGFVDLVGTAEDELWGLTTGGSLVRSP